MEVVRCCLPWIRQGGQVAKKEDAAPANESAPPPADGDKNDAANVTDTTDTGKPLPVTEDPPKEGGQEHHEQDRNRNQEGQENSHEGHNQQHQQNEGHDQQHQQNEGHDQQHQQNEGGHHNEQHDQNHGGQNQEDKGDDDQQSPLQVSGGSKTPTPPPSQPMKPSGLKPNIGFKVREL